MLFLSVLLRAVMQKPDTKTYTHKATSGENLISVSDFSNNDWDDTPSRVWYFVADSAGKYVYSKYSIISGTVYRRRVVFLFTL